MGLLDKLKNIFIEEYEDDEEDEKEKKVKEEKLARKVEIPKSPLRENKVVHEEINLNNVKLEDEEEDEEAEIYVSPKTTLDVSENKETDEVEIKITPEEFKIEPEIEDEGEVVINKGLTNDYTESDLIPETESRPLYPEKKELSYAERVKQSNSYDYSNNYNNNYSSNYNSNYSSSYSKAYSESKEVKKFKPSPVISPVYGILDTNYRKEDIKEKKEPRFVTNTKKVDVDSVRNRAFGDEPKVSYKAETPVTVEKKEEPVKENIYNKVETKVEVNKVENTIANKVEVSRENRYKEEYHKDTEEPKKEKFDVNNTKPQVSKVTLQDADEYYNDLGLAYNVDYKDVSVEGKKEKSNYIVNNTNNTINRNINKNNYNNERMHRYHDDKKKDSAVNDNLFDLIDSMYNKED